MYRYNAICTRVVDGDTYEITVDLGFKITHSFRVRLEGINTSETYGVSKESLEYTHGIAAKEYVESIILGKDLIVETVKSSTGADKKTFGRYRAHIWVAGDDTTLTAKLYSSLFDKSQINEWCEAHCMENDSNV